MDYSLLLGVKRKEFHVNASVNPSPIINGTKYYLKRHMSIYTHM